MNIRDTSHLPRLFPFELVSCFALGPRNTLLVYGCSNLYP